MFLATEGLHFSSNDGGKTLGGYLTAYVGLKAAVALLVSLIQLPLRICFLPCLLDLRKPLWLFRTFFLRWALSLAPSSSLPTWVGVELLTPPCEASPLSLRLTAGFVSPLSYSHLWCLSRIHLLPSISFSPQATALYRVWNFPLLLGAFYICER